jgi:peptide/nickel transport system substrate-binding protein
MKSHGWRRRCLALLMVCGLLLAACSSDSDDEGAGPDDTGSSASDVDPNGVLRLGYDLNQSGVPWDFNPLKFVTGSAQSNDGIWFLGYGRLMRPTADGSVEPDLAESVEIVDKNTINVQLREGLTFSDGSTLDANAVKTSYDTVLAAREANTNGFLPPFYNLKTITVTGPTSLTFGFPDGTAPSWFDQYIPTFASSIFKFGTGDPNTPIGAGPYTISNFQLGQAVSFEKNPSYWNADAIKIAGIDITSVPFSQPNSGIAALQSGQLDVTFSEPALISSISGDYDTITKVSPNTAAMMHICKASGPLADARVRQAVNKGMDREAISEAVYFGTAKPMTERWPEGHRLYNPEVGDVLAYDPEGAKELLAEAGYADGFEMNMYPIQAFNLDETAEVIQSQLKEIGITVNIVPTPDYVNQFLLPQSPGVGLYPSSVPGPQKVTAWTGTSMGNVCKYSNPEIDRLYTSLTGVSEQSEEAVDIWYDIDTLSTEEALSGFIVFRADVGAYNTTAVGDMALWPVGNWIMPDVWQSYMKN